MRVRNNLDGMKTGRGFYRRIEDRYNLPFKAMVTVTAEGEIIGDYWRDLPMIENNLRNKYDERCDIERQENFERAIAEITISKSNAGRPKAEIIPGYIMPEGAVINPEAKHKSYNWDLIIPIVRKLAEKGESYRSIAMTLGIPDQTIYYRIRQTKKIKRQYKRPLRQIRNVWGGVK